MATASAHPMAVSIPGRLVYGVIGGLVGGALFGILMQMMGMIEMIAQLVGSTSLLMGWLVHLFNSALFGAIFALLVGRWADRFVPGVLLGLAYGVLWWVLVALIIMPAWLGMTEMILALNTVAWQSLAGHLLYGLLLGLVFAGLAHRGTATSSS